MVSIRKHGDKWRAEVWRDGKRASKVHRTKREAQEWATREEMKIEVSAGRRLDQMTMAEAVDRYELEIIPERKLKWNTPGSELYVLNLIREDEELSGMALSEITPQDLAAWRDKNLMRVSPASAQRYMNTLSSIFTAAVKDWSAMADNPVAKVRRPAPARKRDRRPTADEIEKLSVAGGDIEMAMGRAHQAFMFAIETGMRASEIAMMSWKDVDIERRVVHVPRPERTQGSGRHHRLQGRFLPGRKQPRGSAQRPSDRFVPS